MGGEGGFPLRVTTNAMLDLEVFCNRPLPQVYRTLREPYPLQLYLLEEGSQLRHTNNASNLQVSTIHLTDLTYHPHRIIYVGVESQPIKESRKHVKFCLEAGRLR